MIFVIGEYGEMKIFHENKTFFFGDEKFFVEEIFFQVVEIL